MKGLCALEKYYLKIAIIIIRSTQMIGDRHIDLNDCMIRYGVGTLSDSFCYMQSLVTQRR